MTKASGVTILSGPLQAERTALGLEDKTIAALLAGRSEALEFFERARGVVQTRRGIRLEHEVELWP